ncbi:hypothetical protein E2C01_023534 [Portunus trituberculatus]|uniref:Uncharacterized protein n=1 Tax=Portunus trituberculatus TaxID=210409 RepID=A0A5B7EBD3_PORTR|nr:hypothetical protein [Portunus trituberculatus]
MQENVILMTAAAQITTYGWRRGRGQGALVYTTMSVDVRLSAADLSSCCVGRRCCAASCRDATRGSHRSTSARTSRTRATLSRRAVSSMSFSAAILRRLSSVVSVHASKSAMVLWNSEFPIRVVCSFACHTEAAAHTASQRRLVAARRSLTLVARLSSRV